MVILYSGKQHLSCSVTLMLAPILYRKYLPAEHSACSSREHSHQTLFYFVAPRFRCVGSMFWRFLECVLDLRSAVVHDVYDIWRQDVMCWTCLSLKQSCDMLQTSSVSKVQRFTRVSNLITAENREETSKCNLNGRKAAGHPLGFYGMG